MRLVLELCMENHKLTESAQTRSHISPEHLFPGLTSTMGKEERKKIHHVKITHPRFLFVTFLEFQLL